MGSSDGLADSLVALGYSQYDARTFEGLLAGGPSQTAYGLWKVTGVPQPKIYEALVRLVQRHAAVQVGIDPKRYTARAVADVLGDLRREFTTRINDAERAAAEAIASAGSEEFPIGIVHSSSGKDAALADAHDLITNAQERLYLSAWGDDLEYLSFDIHQADRRGVKIQLLAFGHTKFVLEHGNLFRHETTAKVKFSHSNRHLAVIADGARGLWSVGAYGEWSSLQFHDHRLISLLRQYIRHDIYVQKIYGELGPEMVSVFGADLESLSDLDHAVPRNCDPSLNGSDFTS
jgi:sugar-specific transcriptional regulator TrmB